VPFSLPVRIPPCVSFHVRLCFPMLMLFSPRPLSFLHCLLRLSLSPSLLPSLCGQVEVAWRGKFRLEASEVYQGLAWWVAEVVDKHTAQVC